MLFDGTIKIPYKLGKMITDGTYYVSCWMTLAQIEKVRSKKVLFSDFDQSD